jgi:uncharacterized protein
MDNRPRRALSQSGAGFERCLRLSAASWLSGCRHQSGSCGQTIHGAPVYARLADVPFAIDMVDIFRNSEAAGDVVDEALALMPLPKVVWMQLGVINEAAAERARARGVEMVMNRCPKIEIARLGLSPI